MLPYHKPLPTQNVFPPNNVVLHPDDAESKVFHAVARAFVSVNNRAMTIKDIAERASAHGLVCQNLSAAAQAVTTYLRMHRARCDKEQDQPLLLSHTLSGTPADDDLLPALYSRSGGDSAQPPPGRTTNFRKGTAVWYLSRATGVPCPFARAGIRLCDYVLPREEAAVRRKEEERVGRCGEKRKRPLRGCAVADETEEEERPPKVKLTLRLKPLLARVSMSAEVEEISTPTPEPEEGSTPGHPISLEDEDSSDDEREDDMSVDEEDEDEEDEDEERGAVPQVSREEDGQWGLPSYSRRSTNTPDEEPVYASTAGAYMSRSPSMPFATPPPDSDDEADDFHLAMARMDGYSDEEDDDHDGWDADLDSEGEEDDTTFESPGPRSPSAPIVQPASITVKEEPRDVQGMLDAWEDFDTSFAVAEVISKALETDRCSPPIKLEPIDPWEWNTTRPEWPAEDLTHIKQEEVSVDINFLFPPGPSSPLSPLASLTAQFANFGYADTQPGTPSEVDDESVRGKSATGVRPRAQTVPVPSPSGSQLPPPPATAPLGIMRASSSASSLGGARTACVSPLETRCQPTFPLSRAVVVTTCQPCKPAISATEIEDISVYQMMLGPFQLLRRIDTDFVNLSPILAIAATPLMAELPKNAMVVTRGSPEVCGTWVPLAVAQEYVQENLAASAKLAEEEREALSVFLSDRLVELFPPALQDFHRTTPARGLLNQFGRHFASTLQAAKWEAQAVAVEGASPGGSPASTSTSTVASSVALATPSPPPSASGASSAVPPPFLVPVGLGLGEKHVPEKEVPLSATERQLFNELCVLSEDDEMAVDRELELCERPVTPTVAVPVKTAPQEEMMSPLSPMSALSDSPLSSPLSSPTMTAFRRPLVVPPQASTPKPLRRSKRVAEARTQGGPSAHTRTRATRKGGASRNSLS